MARTYKRDTFGRFAGGGGGGGKLGKSAKNSGARAKFKAAASQLRDATKTAQKQAAKAGAPNAMGRGYLKTARANMTRTTNKLTGRGAASRPAAGPVAARPASAAASAPGGRMRQSRDNAGRITAAGQGATARGGRLRTASGKKRAAQTSRLRGGGASTIAKGGNGVSGSVARSLRSMRAKRG